MGGKLHECYGNMQLLYVGKPYGEAIQTAMQKEMHFKKWLSQPRKWGTFFRLRHVLYKRKPTMKKGTNSEL